MTSWSRWQDWTMLVLGVYMLCVPLFTQDSPGNETVWTAELVGAAVTIVAIWALASPTQNSPEGTQVVLGLLLVLAPPVLGYTEYGGASTNAYVVGGVTIALAIWAWAEIAKSRDRHLTTSALRH